MNEHWKKDWEKFEHTDAPDFLWTRIQAKIQSNSEFYKNRSVLVFSITSLTAVLLIIGIVTLSDQRNMKQSNSEYSPKYQLYED